MLRVPAGKHVAALPDLHTPHENPLNGVLGFLQDWGVEDLVLLGDFLNLEWASHWNERMFKLITVRDHLEKLTAEMTHARGVLKLLRQAAGKKCRFWYVLGNHEKWLWHACFNHRLIALPFHKTRRHSSRSTSPGRPGIPPARPLPGNWRA